MHFTNFKFLALLFVIGSVPCWAQGKAPDICNRYSAVPLPPEASVTTPTEFPACGSYKLYAGIGRDTDYEAARGCAWQERAANIANLRQNSAVPIAWAVGGAITLADIYANGFGTPQNIPLAGRLICEQDGMLRKEAVSDLEARKVSAEKSAKAFDLCGYAATTFQMNFCAAYSAERDNDQRERTMASVSSSWTEAQKAAFAIAQQAFEDYAHSVAAEETYKGGTIRTIRANGVEQELRQNFVSELQKLEGGTLPGVSAADAKRADVELNTVYHSATDAAQTLKPSDPEQVQPSGIRETERSWLRYRDAWVTFAMLRYPSTTREDWLGQLTRLRTQQLKLLLCSLDAKSSVCTPAILQELDSLL